MRSIAGVGCDIVSVARIEALLSRPRFSEKVYTPRERAYLRSCAASSAAGLWAAKEAVSKALGTGFAGFTARDVEICRADSGQPRVLLHRGAAAAAAAQDVTAVHLSISHDGGCALAFAAAERNAENAPDFP